MDNVGILFANGFEEIEAITLVDVLRRADIETTTISIGGPGPVTGSHGITVETDLDLDSAINTEWGMIVLPGGMPGSTALRDDPRVQELLRSQDARGAKIGAICAAPIALGAAGVLAGRKATCYPGFEKELTGADCRQERVVRDGNLITSRGPGTAMEFALAIVKDLRGDAVASDLRQKMLVRSDE